MRVVLKAKVTERGEACYGTWDEETRVIEIDSTPPLEHQWRVLYHELTHVAFTDSGLDEMMTAEALEAACDANATARMRERFG